MKVPSISKSSFGSGLQCHKRLWVEKNDRNLVPQPSLAQQAIFDQGHEVGSWSHRLFPEGILLSGEMDFEVHLQASRDALGTRKPLFEPAFSIPGAYARADILVPVENNGWNLLEVKSASDVWDKGEIKDVYLQDIAFQIYVYRQAGIDIRKSFLVFLNRNYVKQGDVIPHQLFRQEDVTVQAEALVSTIPSQLARLQLVLEGAVVPNTAIGPHCYAPYDCSLLEHCWKDVPADSVFSLVRAGARAWTWWEGGINRVSDLPATERFSTTQAIQVQAEKANTPHFDAQAIASFLQGLEYPLYYLDFETVMPAVPMFDGCRPYAQVPFQFSLHLQNIPGAELSHHQFLADGVGDPRLGFLQALRPLIGHQGSIVTYNSGFETARLRELALHFPEHAAWIGEALKRFEDADLLQPFRSFAAYHPIQHGCASIKAVLPAFTELGYGDLAIQEGGTASNHFLSLLKGHVPAERIAGVRGNLLKYCERDTWAMVKLVEALRSKLFRLNQA
jgi:hypothetical protein